MEQDGRFEARLRALDLGLFDAIASQTSALDRRCLLAMQVVCRERFGEYAYLEIGSHLGGSLQTHLLDPRCRKLYSIDSRSAVQPDDRGKLDYYPGNATERMLGLLETLAGGERLARLSCFESEASRVDRRSIDPAPHLCFIDGEHTRKAALEDFEFCRGVAREDALICFHDAWIVSPAVREAKRRLRRSGIPFEGAPLQGSHYVLALGERPLLELQPLADQRRGELMFHLRAALRRRHHRWVMQPLRRRKVMKQRRRVVDA
jgi:Methyltransferase domain